MYDPKSKHAEDFINHEEIMETLDYARKNKTNRELIGEILEKAKKRKGLSHREAAVLLDCELDDKNQEIFTLAEQIKRFLRKPHRNVCAVVSLKLLREWMSLLSISS